MSLDYGAASLRIIACACRERRIFYQVLLIIFRTYMLKIVKAVGVMGMFAAMPFMALASSNISNIKFDNGQTQMSCTAGQSVNVTFRVVVPAGEVAELGQVDVLGDNLAPALPFALGGNLGLQEGATDVSTSVTCPQNTGYYTVEFRTAGIFGGQTSVAITDGVTSIGSFTNALRVTASNSTSTSGSEVPAWQQAISALTAQMNALIASMTHPVPPAPVPVPPSGACAQLASAMSGAMMGVNNSANITLQGFLLYQHMSIPALAQGASFGFWGPQTNAALMQFKAQNACN